MSLKRTNTHTETMHSWSYRGVACEAYAPTGSYTWRSYIYLILDHFKDQELADGLWLSVPYDYTRVDLFNDMQLHGGITFYRKSLSLSRKNFEHTELRTIKIGCDYNHLWDEGCFYSFEDVRRDIEASVDRLHELTAYRLWCRGSGNLFEESEGAYENGWFYSNAYRAQYPGRVSI